MTLIAFIGIAWLVLSPLVAVVVGKSISLADRTTETPAASVSGEEARRRGARHLHSV